MLCDQLDLAHLLLPRYEPLIEEPAEPFEITFAAEGFQLVLTWSTMPASA